MNTETHVSTGAQNSTDRREGKQHVGPWTVIRDFLSCFRLPRSLYGGPSDDLTAYARAIALYGVESDEAQELLRRNGNKYFQSRARILAACKNSLEQGTDDHGPISRNPITAGDYAMILFRQSEDIALVDPDFEPSPAFESQVGSLLDIVHGNCPNVERVGFFIRSHDTDVDSLREQCKGFAKVIPPRMAMHVFCARPDAVWTDFPSHGVLTDQGGFEYLGNELSCSTSEYRLVAPDRHIVQWQRLRDRSPDLGLIGDFDVESISTGRRETTLNL